MSLLMKALEKAAKDRDEARAEPVTAAPGSEPVTMAPGSEPGSEPPITVTYSPSDPPSFSPATPAATPGARSELSLEPMPTPTEPSASPPPPRPEPPSRPAATTRAGRTAAAAREQQAKAATVMRASGPAAGNAAIAWLLARPVWIVGILAILIGIGYGTYVYLQLFHPALFLPKPPLAPKASPPPPSPIGQAPAPPPGTGTVLGPATPAAGTLPAEAAPGPSSPTLSAVQAATPDAAPPPPPSAAPTPSRAPQKGAVEARPPALSTPAPAPAPRDAIVVSRGSAAPAVSPLLTDAYGALRADRRDDAQRMYDQLLRNEPRNIDALLGLAAIATTEGRSEEATRRYVQVLELDPRNALAQSGLIGLLGRADPLAAESRLKQLIAREPSAYLHFTLGNLYADQSQWPAAQQAYFQAHHLEPNNPDYAYNLAVGLEHVSQTKLALGFYRRAVELAGTTGLARFNVALAQQRISKLASQVE